MSEEKTGIVNSIFNIFEKIDIKYGPSKLEHKPACYETREMLMDCVL